PVRRLVLRARPRHRRPAARGARAGDGHRDRGRRRPAGGEHPRCRPDRRARRRRRGRDRHPRRAARRVPDLRRDRRVPVHPGGSGMTGPSPAAHTNGAAREMSAQRRGGPPWAGMGMPAERSLAFGPSARRLLGRLAPERLRVLAVVVLAVLSVALSSVGPLVLGRATDVIFAGVIGQRLEPGASVAEVAAAERAAGNDAYANVLEGAGVVPGRGVDFTLLVQVLVAVMVIYVAASLFAYLQGYLLNGVVQRTIFALRRDVEDKINRLPLSYFDGQPRGELLSRVSNDIDNVSQSLQQTMSQLLTSLLTIVGVLVAMLVISPLLALVVIVSVPPSLLVSRAIMTRSQKQFVAQWRHTGELNAHIEEAFTGHELVRVFGRRRDVEAEFARRNEQLFGASYLAQFISGIIMPSMMFI